MWKFVGAIALALTLLAVFFLPAKAPELDVSSPPPFLTAHLEKDYQVPTVLPSPTPTPIPENPVFGEKAIKAGTVVLKIPVIGIETPLEVAEIVWEDDKPAFTSRGDEIPLWVPGWVDEIGAEGIAVIYGGRQWGPIPKIFTALDKLMVGDLIFITSGNETLIFKVFEVSIVDPPEILWDPIIFEKQDQAKIEGKHQLALVTCTPWGTDQQRLVVYAQLLGDF